MAVEPRKKPLYLSLETNLEFIARVKCKHPWWAPNGWRALDDEVWDTFRMQRKIVERG